MSRQWKLSNQIKSNCCFPFGVNQLFKSPFDIFQISTIIIFSISMLGSSTCFILLFLFLNFQNLKKYLEFVYDMNLHIYNLEFVSHLSDHECWYWQFCHRRVHTWHSHTLGLLVHSSRAKSCKLSPCNCSNWRWRRRRGHCNFLWTNPGNTRVGASLLGV